MLEHVYRRARLSDVLDDVVIATCDGDIRDAAENFGARVIITSDEHTRCTDRVAEAAHNVDADVVVNVQGDEPLLHPEVIDKVATPFSKDASVVCTTIMELIGEEDLESPDIVKTVCSLSKQVLYFSREPIPSRKLGVTVDWYKQAGIYAFTRDFLLKLESLSETPLERAESVDLMRVLEHGYPVHGVLSERPSLGVDTPDDLARAEELMDADPIFSEYAVS